MFSGFYPDPTVVADQLKKKGCIIITVAAMTNSTESVEVDDIATNLASVGLSFVSNDTDIYNKMLHGICQGTFLVLPKFVMRRLANCFCPSGWTQVMDDFVYPTKRFGECVKLVQRNATWADASASCSKIFGKNAFLASEITKSKQSFNAHYMYNLENTLGATIEGYHIGLRFDAQSGLYMWQKKDGNGVSYAVVPIC